MPGAARRADEIGDPASSCTTPRSPPTADTVMHLLHTAEEAAALGADMVVLNCYVGTGDIPAESALLEKLATISAECEEIGMPLCAEIIPRVKYADPAQKMPTSEDMAMAMRLGLEYGCDVIKTVYNGDPGGYAKAIAAGHLPVIMAGGPKTSGETAFFRQVHEARRGACGVAIGRRVWAANARSRRSRRSRPSCSTARRRTRPSPSTTRTRRVRRPS
jgi:DhnA family fructose-bisphosphate aldolase class Ia